MWREVTWFFCLGGLIFFVLHFLILNFHFFKRVYTYFWLYSRSNQKSHFHITNWKTFLFSIIFLFSSGVLINSILDLCGSYDISTIFSLISFSLSLSSLFLWDFLKSVLYRFFFFYFSFAYHCFKCCFPMVYLSLTSWFSLPLLFSSSLFFGHIILHFISRFIEFLISLISFAGQSSYFL